MDGVRYAPQKKDKRLIFSRLFFFISYSVSWVGGKIGMAWGDGRLEWVADGEVEAQQAVTDSGDVEVASVAGVIGRM